MDRLPIVKYFGYGTNKDLDMMVHMVGRNDLHGKPGKLLGYELCTQRLDQIRDSVPSQSPVRVSPRAIIHQTYGDTFDLYIARPKNEGIIYGTIWDLTTDEMELVKEWELVDYGMQEEVHAIAVDVKGAIISVETQAVMNPPAEIDKNITGENYEPYIVLKSKMLEAADNSRIAFLQQREKNKSV
jgi:hypothetical protein